MMINKYTQPHILQPENVNISVQLLLHHHTYNHCIVKTAVSVLLLSNKGVPIPILGTIVLCYYSGFFFQECI